MTTLIVGLIACAIGFIFGLAFTHLSNNDDPDLLERMTVNEGLIDACSSRISAIEKAQSPRTVYLVTYSINGCGPLHTVFDNKEYADKMENYLLNSEHDYVLNEAVPVYKHFSIT